jgi:uncharacterized protein (TIGR03066 family)
MRSIVAVGVAVLALEMTAVAGPIEASKLIGVWELTKVEGQAEAPHWRIEFLKDGKHRMTSKRDGKEYKIVGKHELKKDKLTLTVLVDGKTADTKTVTVQQLTDEMLVFVDNKKKLEFKRGKRGSDAVAVLICSHTFP